MGKHRVPVRGSGQQLTILQKHKASECVWQREQQSVPAGTKMEETKRKSPG